MKVCDKCYNKTIRETETGFIHTSKIWWCDTCKDECKPIVPRPNLTNEYIAEQRRQEKEHKEEFKRTMYGVFDTSPEVVNITSTPTSTSPLSVYTLRDELNNYLAPHNEKVEVIGGYIGGRIRIEIETSDPDINILIPRLKSFLKLKCLAGMGVRFMGKRPSVRGFTEFLFYLEESQSSSNSLPSVGNGNLGASGQSQLSIGGAVDLHSSHSSAILKAYIAEDVRLTHQLCEAFDTQEKSDYRQQSPCKPARRLAVDRRNGHSIESRLQRRYSQSRLK